MKPGKEKEKERKEKEDMLNQNDERKEKERKRKGSRAGNGAKGKISGGRGKRNYIRNGSRIYGNGKSGVFYPYFRH